MEKSFDSWNEKKKRLQKSPAIKYFSEGQIWYFSCGVNVGFEQDGKGKNFLRPVLIILRFNSRAFWGIPLTTVSKKGRFYFKFEFQKGKISYAILSQLRLFDSKRLLEKKGRIPKNLLKEIKKELKKLL